MALVDLGLAIDTALEEGFPGRVEGTVEDGEESASFLGEDLAMLVVHGAQDGDILELYFDLAHVDCLLINAGDDVMNEANKVQEEERNQAQRSA
jgi:hypothetical protein